MPLLLMLIAGACTCIITLVRSYSVLASLVALFAVMLLFYCLGSAIRLLLDRFDRQNEEKAKQEQEANAISAIYIETGEFLKTGLFVDLNNGTIFDAKVPAEGIYN